MNNNQKETQLLYIQIYASIIFIITILLSIILTYNNIKKKNGCPFFSKFLENNLTIINRIIITFLVIVFTYINYEFYIISKQKNNRDNIQKNEFIASIITLIADFILLYTTIKSVYNDETFGDIDTPLI